MKYYSAFLFGAAFGSAVVILLLPLFNAPVVNYQRARDACIMREIKLHPKYNVLDIQSECVDEAAHG